MWRLLYAPRKLSSVARQELESLLEDYTFSCGAALSDLELLSVLSEACARDLQCYDPVEKIVLFYELRSDMYILLCRRESGNKRRVATILSVNLVRIKFQWKTVLF